MIRSATFNRPGTRNPVRSSSGGHEIASFAETPLFEPNARLLVSANEKLAAVVLLPAIRPGDGPLPVLLDPYGGRTHCASPSQNAYLTSQWFADQGFAVLVTNGRGTGARQRMERAVHGDLAGPALDDQIDALEPWPQSRPRLRGRDPGMVFGGYLAALAVLRRPDCSMRRSPARRSPSGGSTTPTTPSVAR